jgi:hypothetical protein
MAHETVNITALDLLGAHRIRLTFDDGAVRDRDLSPLLTGPVFNDIRTSPVEFSRAFIDPELGVLCWPGGVDIDAELLRYDDLWNEAVSLADTA